MIQHKKGALLSGRPRVCVTQEQPFDFTPAQQFGDVEFLTGEDLVNIKDSQRNTQLMRDLWRKLRRFDTERDWLLIAGSPYVSAAVFLILGHMGIKKLQVLRWSNRDGHYVPLHLNLQDLFLNPVT